MLIPLIPSKRAGDSSDAIGFYVLTDPDDADSDKIKKYVQPFENGGPEELLEFVNDFNDLCKMKRQQENGPAMFTTIRLLLKGDALEGFRDAHNEVTEDLEDGDEDETAEIFDETLTKWIDSEIQEGDRAAKDLKKDLMYSNIKKPTTLTVTQFVKRLKKINRFIGYLPGDAEPLTNDELLTVLEKAMPNSWINDLKRRADYNEMTLLKATKYFKLLEEMDPPRKNMSKTAGKEFASGSRGNHKTHGRKGWRSSKTSKNDDQRSARGGLGRSNDGNDKRTTGSPPSRSGNHLRRSNRKRGPYCPHHRTDAHEGRDCPEYQEYLRTKRQTNQSNAVEERHAESNAIVDPFDSDKEAYLCEEMTNVDLPDELADDFFDFFVNDFDSLETENSDELTPFYAEEDDFSEELFEIEENADDDKDEGDDNGSVPPLLEPDEYSTDTEDAYNSDDDASMLSVEDNDDLEVMILTIPDPVEEWPERMTEYPKSNEEECFHMLDQTGSRILCTIQVQLAKTAYEKARYPPYKRPVLKALLDTGATRTFASPDVVPEGIAISRDTKTTFETQGGPFEAKGTAVLEMILPEFSPHRKFRHTVHVHHMPSSRYDLIFGRDLMIKLGIQIDFATMSLKWGELEIPMPLRNGTHDQELNSVTPASIKCKIDNALPDTLTPDQRTALADVLMAKPNLFAPGIGTLPCPPVSVEPKQVPLRPYFRKPYRVPLSILEEAKAEIEQYVRHGILKPTFDSPWGSPTMVLRKPDGGLRIVTDFRKVNEMLRRKPYPMPKIDEKFQSMDGFDFISSIDLYKGFYHVRLDEEAKKIFTTVLPWGKYSYQRMPMGYLSAPDTFQYEMDKILGDLPFCVVFIDDVCIYTKGSFDDHLMHLVTVLDRLAAANVRVNLEKSKFVADKLKYLGFVFSKDGIRADPKKAEAIKNIQPPKSKKQLRSFLGMTNYLRNHVPRYSHHSAPLTDLLQNKSFQWTTHAQQAFETLKNLIARAVMLSFPDFTKPFEIFTDASKLQIGAVIMQRTDNGDFQVIALFSKKMNGAQTRYTVTEQELLSIVETLKTYRYMLLGFPIVIYTDHKNLTFEKFASDRVARWRLYVEEYSPEIKYVPGKHNLVADALSRLPMRESEQATDGGIDELMEISAHSWNDQCPIDFRVLAECQRKELPNKIFIQAKEWKVGDVVLKLNRNGRVMVPESLRMPLMEFYHDTLRHPGVVRMTNTLWMNFAWPSMKEDVMDLIKKCDLCQRFKKNQKQYGLLPAADARTLVPWDQVAVDLIGPWTIKAKNRTVQLTAMTIIDLATRWIEIVRVHSKDSENVALLFDRWWINRYPRPTKVIHDSGTEFSGEFRELLESTGIEDVTTTVKNPRANAILERVHDVIGNMLRTYDFENQFIDDWGKDKQDPLDGFLQAVAFAIRATYQTSIGTSPAALAFGRDMFFPTKYVANWKLMKKMRGSQMEKGRLKENAKRIPHRYRPNDMVLIRHDMDGQPRGKMQCPTSGPYKVLRVRGPTLEIDRGPYIEKVNLRRVQPYHSLS